VDVFIMTDHANNNVIVFGRDNRDFIAILVLLVVFAFAFGNDIPMPNLPLKSSIALISWQSVMAFNNAEPMLKRLKTAALAFVTSVMLKSSSLCLCSSNLGTFWLKIEQFWPFEEISIFFRGDEIKKIFFSETTEPISTKLC
jgi:hypothetical protein